jgi:1,5-anhydro-D-fructose reductase (1,5-anhydro-D-mannitol-forming)
VYVSSTNQHHHAQVLAAAAARRHVLCEKPLAMTLADAVDMARACQVAGVVLATNHHLRNAVTLRAMRDLVARGAIGTPAAVMASQPAYVAERDWRRVDAAAGAGVSYDVLVHTSDAVRFVLGQEPTQVAALGRSGSGMAAGVNDFIMATFRFDGGVIAQLHADFNSPHGRSRLEIHGSQGSLIGTDVLGKNSMYRGRVLLRREQHEDEVATESDESRYRRGIDLFNAAVRGHGRPACTGADGIRSLAMILAAEQAAASGRTVEVSDAGREFL